MSEAAVDRQTRGTSLQNSEPPIRRWWILFVISTAWLMVILDATIVNVALPSAQRSLAFSIADRQWVVTAYSLTFGCLLLISGRVSHIFGRKQTFIVGLIGFVIASVVGGASTSFAMLIGARAVQGAFAALITPAALGILTTTFVEDVKDRETAFAIYSAIAAVGGAVGLLLGGVLTQYLSWRWCMYVNVVFAATALVGAVLLIHDKAVQSEVTWDIPGSTLSVAGVAAVIFGFAEASLHGWSDAWSWGLIAGGVVLLGVFILVETRVRHPLAPLRIFNRIRGASYLSRTVNGIGVAGMFLIMTYYFQGVLGYSAVKTGVSFLPFVGGFVISAQLVQKVLLGRLGPKVVVSLSLAVGAAGAGWLAQIGLYTNYRTLVAPLVLLGLGIGGTMVSTTALGVAVSEPRDIPSASALTGATFQLGQSMGAALLNTIAVTVSIHYLAVRGRVADARLPASLHGDVIALTALLGIFVGAALISVVLYPRRPAPAVTPEP
jgi:EmrB/QacA subfamily drug resistance transporter